MKKTLTLIALAIFSFSCSNKVSSFEETENSMELSNAIKIPGGYSSNRANQNPINIVYFVPADVAAPSSTILENYGKSVIFAQNWYEKQMDFYGYGSKTFALFTKSNNTIAKVIVINGQEDASYYGLGTISDEIDAYFASHPNEIGSNDAIVATDESLGYSVAQTGNNFVDGRYGFVRSTDNWNLVDSGKDFNGLDILTCGRITSIMHEGAHVFGVPHYAHKNSDSPNRCLMGGGAGSGFWEAGNEDKVFLTNEGAAICNTSRAFNTTNNSIDYYDVTPTVDLVNFSIEKNSTLEATEYDFVITSDVKPTYAYVAYDWVGGDTYGTVPFGTKDVVETENNNEYSFHLEALYSDYFNSHQDANKTGDINLKVYIVAENGGAHQIFDHVYSISSAPTPNDDINVSFETLNVTELNKANWTVTYASTQQGTGTSKEKLIDGDINTFWHSQWSPRNGTLPEDFIIDFGSSINFDGLTFVQRQNNNNVTVRGYTVEKSTDNTNWTTVGDYQLANIKAKQYLEFDSTQTARYIRITVNTAHNSDVCALAEVGAF